jgi:hypothetical protein
MRWTVAFSSSLAHLRLRGQVGRRVGQVRPGRPELVEGGREAVLGGFAEDALDLEQDIPAQAEARRVRQLLTDGDIVVCFADAGDVGNRHTGTERPPR